MRLLKSQIFMLSAALAAVSLSSCSDDLQSPTEIAAPSEVPADIHADFTRSYPDAADVAWTVSDGYAVASFITANADAAVTYHSSVWYCLNDNQKKMHSAPISFTDLPEAVRSAFLSGEYASLTPYGPVHVITRYLDGEADHIYILKAKGALEGTASTAVKLYYTADGMLVKVSSEIVYDDSFLDHEGTDEFKEWLPEPTADFVRTYVDAHYPGARCLYVNTDRDRTKAKILDGHTVRMLLFDADGEWISTATEIDSHNMPADILAAFRTSEFADWNIHDITEYAAASDGHYYLLSLEKDKNKAELRIEADGTLADEPVNPGHTSGEESYLAKAEIEGFIMARYPGATIEGYDFDDDDAEVEIIYDNHKIKVEFDLYAQGYLWKQSEWDFDVRDASSLPAVISETLSARYGAYRLTYLVYHESADAAPYYEAGLKSASSKETMKVTFDVNGNVIAEYGKH